MSQITSFFFHWLITLYNLTGNLGLAIIVFTIIVRLLLLPLTIPSLKAMKHQQQQMKKLKPELDQLKAKHKDDKTAFQQAQMELYKKYNINPLSGCLPQLVQLVLLAVLYQVFIKFLSQTTIEGVTIDPSFLWLNLSHPDPRFVLPVLAGVTQLFLSLMVAPATEIKDEVANNSKNKKTQVANKKEEDIAEMAATMQQQMIFILPVMIGFSALRFPAGLALYWTITTLFSIIQQFVLSGPGGLKTYATRLVTLTQRFRS